jgi:hypothetical protein
MDVKLTYVGAYEVNTPAGKFPSILTRAEFDIKIRSAKVLAKKPKLSGK